jgi:hypothetical protein
VVPIGSRRLELESQPRIQLAAEVRTSLVALEGCVRPWLLDAPLDQFHRREPIDPLADAGRLGHVERPARELEIAETRALAAACSNANWRWRLMALTRNGPPLSSCALSHRPFICSRSGRFLLMN